MISLKEVFSKFLISDISCNVWYLSILSTKSLSKSTGLAEVREYIHSQVCAMSMCESLGAIIYWKRILYRELCCQSRGEFWQVASGVASVVARVYVAESQNDLTSVLQGQSRSQASA